ncbi:valine--tRNA ligase [bacterium]|nr:valine--tRNA ligase [bacterium]
MAVPTKYQPKKVEEKWYRYWMNQGYFHAEVDRKRKPFTVVIPPPNITGSLHMGHALNSTLQDILVRYKRMKNYNACWIPGTDHAGIATQNVVEKELLKEGKSRFDLGRERFIKKVWEWKEKYGDRIIEQLKRLGCSCDWERLRFTMDKGCSEAVTETFVKLYEKDLIYRDEYIINWCPRCQTALSDIEVEHEDEKSYLYYIKYPFKTGGQLESGKVRKWESEKGKYRSLRPRGARPRLWRAITDHRSPDFITVATTRPETMLGDTAVAVNPKDKRFKGLIDKTLILPIMNREIPLIADDYVDPEFGTGAVKITPAHDPNDFEIGRKHKLPEVRVIDTSGKMTKEAGKYEGWDRYECRKRLLEDLEKKGYLEKKEDYSVPVGRCYRCSTPIEPLISLQWFLKVKKLAKPAIEVVKKGRIEYIPKRWEKVYLDWMEGLKDWCLSRQIWWGHRIPVYYCKKQQDPRSSILDPGKNKHPASRIKHQEGCPPIVARKKPKECPRCGNKNLIQDPDVLDTWFSSALWPFSILGWPEKTKDLAYFYPTSLLITGHEIIHLWVARMIKMGLELMDDIPFSEVYIHGIVRDKKGKKMSKSLGNVIDPLDIIAEYGTDALRFTLASSCAQGQDLQLFDEKFISSRNFANKIWNASRFVLLNLQNFKPVSSIQDLGSDLTLADRWILSRYHRTVKEVTDSIEKYRISEAAQILYQFIWHEFCDWYLEMIKPRLYDGEIDPRSSILDPGKDKHPASSPRTKLGAGQGIQSAPSAPGGRDFAKGEEGRDLAFGGHPGSRKTAQYVMCYVLEGTLRLLHPFMPFITEEIWQALKRHTQMTADINADDRRLESIMISSWPEVDKKRIDTKIEKEMTLIIGIVTSIRNIKSELEIIPTKKIETFIKAKEKKDLSILEKNSHYIKDLARISALKIGSEIEKPRPPFASAVIGEIEAWVPLKGLIDLEKERGRLKRQMGRVEEELERARKKLKNKDFLNKAPERVIVKEREKAGEFKEKLEKLRKSLKSLAAK